MYVHLALLCSLHRCILHPCRLLEGQRKEKGSQKRVLFGDAEEGCVGSCRWGQGRAYLSRNVIEVPSGRPPGKGTLREEGMAREMVKDQDWDWVRGLERAMVMDWDWDLDLGIEMEIDGEFLKDWDWDWVTGLVTGKHWVWDWVTGKHWDWDLVMEMDWVTGSDLEMDWDWGLVMDWD